MKKTKKIIAPAALGFGMVFGAMVVSAHSTVTVE